MPPVSKAANPAIVPTSYSPGRPGDRPKIVNFRVDSGFRVRVTDKENEGGAKMLSLQPSRDPKSPHVVSLEERFAIRMQQNNKGVILKDDGEDPARERTVPSAEDVGAPDESVPDDAKTDAKK